MIQYFERCINSRTYILNQLKTILFKRAYRKFCMRLKKTFTDTLELFIFITGLFDSKMTTVYLMTFS